MIYGGDLAMQMPIMDLYDRQVMAMSINAARDMYEKGQKQIDDFYSKYGDFMSPFSKDMERYNQIVGGVRDIINNAYAQGIDPLRSPEGRALVAQAVRSVNPAEISAMRANAKMGYAYQDAMQKLRSSGKFSQAQEDFDIAQNGGTAFQDFATANGQGGFNSWDRSSPIEATTLRELTQDSYKGRTPRTLTKEDFLNDPRLAGKYAYDPRYEWTGYLYSDLLKNAPGASASLAADPRAAFFRDQARQMVIAAGKEPTAENVEAQYQRNIADANTWALVDPTRKADEYAKMATEFSYNSRLQNQAHRNKMNEIAAAGDNKEKYDGNYLRAIGIDAGVAGFSAGVRLGTDHADAINAINKKYKNNPVAAERARNNALTEFFFRDKRYGDGHSSVAQIIKNLPNNDTTGGHKSVDILNGILKNFAANSDDVNNGKYLLEKAGYVYNQAEKHWEPGKNANGKVVSPHELMRNIINFQFTGQLKGGTSKQQLIKKLEQSAGGYNKQSWYDVSWRAPGEIAAGAEAIYPDAADHGVIIAPDETGKNKLWVRVGLSGGGMFRGDSNYKGYWLQVPIEYGTDYQPTSTSEASIYASGVHERKDYGNSAVTTEFNSMRE